MILFKEIRFQNLLSSGNQPTIINLHQNPITIVVGANGSGKSTLNDALCFVLFGKAFRNINKGQLVNSINQKGLLVEIDFAIGTIAYKIRRGIKPNIFEIYKNGELMNQEANAKDYQADLEKNILKMNFKSFQQVVILGNATYIPFMRLTPAQRREIVEDLLDIKIFSHMNQLLKTEMGVNKGALEQVEYELRAVNDSLETLKKYQTNNQDKIDKNNQDIEAHQKELDVLDNHITPDIDDTKVIKTLNKLLQYQTKFKERISLNTKNIKFFGENDTCPTCKQDIDGEFKSGEIASLTEKNEEVYKVLKEANKKITEAEKKKEIVHTNIRILTARNIKMRGLQSSIQQLQKFNKELSETKVVDPIILDKQKKLVKRKAHLAELAAYHKRIKEIISDGGVKSMIIFKYLPVMNQLINKYLAAMNFFVNFTLNETFEETIKSRNLDEFSYSNFSEGEKSRINIALLFVFRAMARMKNSAHTNILIMDETFDSSLDTESSEDLLKILKKFEKENIFIISHKQNLSENFNHVLKFEKINNFSVMTKPDSSFL